jgi:hypothetical protein
VDSHQLADVLANAILVLPPPFQKRRTPRNWRASPKPILDRYLFVNQLGSFDQRFLHFWRGVLRNLDCANGLRHRSSLLASPGQFSKSFELRASLKDPRSLRGIVSFDRA